MDKPQNALAGRRVALRRHPEGPVQPEDFIIEAMSTAPLAEGEFLVRNLLVSVDPMLRLFVDKAPLGGAFPPLPLGTTIPGPAVGQVVRSRHPTFNVGAFVEGRFGWADYAVSSGAGVQRVPATLQTLEDALGLGGLPGFTAYVGLEAAGGVKPGRTVLVSGAAGAVGSAVGTFVRARGGRAVGVASSEAKRRYLIEEAGYEAAVDRSADDFVDQLKVALPEGAHVYFDNVGGPLMATVAPLMARGGLILISGLMAQYEGESGDGVDHLPAVLRAVMGSGVRIEGFTQFGKDALRPAFATEVATLIASGHYAPKVHIKSGLEALPGALQGLFNKSVAGKVVVRIATPDASLSEQGA